MNDRTLVRKAFERIKPAFVITGFAPGADRIANEIAEAQGIPRVIYPANWVGEGKAAGFSRNARMLSEGKPDLVAAFPGGPGTADMVRRAEAAGVRVTQVSWANGEFWASADDEFDGIL